MTRFLFDSGIASDFINRRNGVRERAKSEMLNGNAIGIGVPVLGELAAGIERSRSRERNMKLLNDALSTLRLWPFDREAAFEYGRLHAELTRTGRPMQVIDIMIAAIARTIGNCVVVTTDGDLSAVPGLRVENWAEESSK